MGSQVNLDRVYMASTYFKSKGFSTVRQSCFPAKLQLDIPFFYSLNTTVNSFTKDELSNVIQVGVNLRYEASLLNTLFRREQTRHGLNYLTVGAFSSLRYQHCHEGNSFHTLFSLLENRISFIKKQSVYKKPLGLLIGVNTLRISYSTFLQQRLHSLGKACFIKTKTKDRLGYVHSSIGSLAFAHLGLYTNKVTSKKYFTRMHPDYINEFRAITNNKTIINLETKSLYECSGSVLALEGRIRKHQKVINHLPNNHFKVKDSFEKIISNF